MSNQKTLEQQIAETEARLARLKASKEKTANGQKVVLGGMVLSVARKNPQFASRLIAMIDSEVTRDTDKKRLEPIVAELKELVGSSAPVAPAQPQAQQPNNASNGSSVTPNQPQQSNNAPRNSSEATQGGFNGQVVHTHYNR